MGSRSADLTTIRFHAAHSGHFAPSATGNADGERDSPPHVFARFAAEECPVARYWCRRTLFKGRADVQQVSRAMIPVSRAAAAPRSRLYSAFNRSRRCTRYSLFDPSTGSSSKHGVQRYLGRTEESVNRLIASMIGKYGDILEFKRANVSLNLSSALWSYYSWRRLMRWDFHEPFVRCLFKG